jgi:hypothetical protein
MTVDVYTLMIGLGLSVLTVLACMAMLLGWFFYLDSKLRRSQTQSADGRPHGLPLAGLRPMPEGMHPLVARGRGFRSAGSRP